MLGLILNMATIRNRNPSSSNNQPFHHLFTQSSSWAVSTRAYISSDIKPGQAGRMRYLATDWNARAADNTHIPAGTEVVPLARQGNTWLVTTATDSTIQQAA